MIEHGSWIFESSAAAKIERLWQELEKKRCERYSKAANEPLSQYSPWSWIAEENPHLRDLLQLRKREAEQFVITEESSLFLINEAMSDQEGFCFEFLGFMVILKSFGRSKNCQHSTQRRIFVIASYLLN